MIDQARIINLEHGQVLRRIDLHLPPKLVEREITGRIVWPDGTPVMKLDFDPETVASPELSVVDAQKLTYVSQLRGSRNSAIKFDDNGNFSAIGFEGHAYVIHARAFDRDDRPLRSRHVRVLATENFKPVTLVLSIPALRAASKDEIRREIGEAP